MEYELKDAFIKYLDCPCKFFEPMEEDQLLQKAYQEAAKRGKECGFIPVLVAVDETLWECLIMNSDEGNKFDEKNKFDSQKVAEYRKRMMSGPLKSGKEVFGEWFSLREEEANENGFDWEEIVGEVESGGDENAMNSFAGYWDYVTRKTYPVVLAEIPVKNPWEIFAWLPFGGWNECPDTPDLMAVAKYWYEKHGAVLAVMTHDVLEFDVPKPVEKEEAKQLALEQYAWDPDVVDGADLTVGMLADCLMKSTTWYFWWD